MTTNLFSCTDFKEYLRRFYEEKKKSNPRFSYRLLAEKAGFNNKGFVFNIIKGERKLSKTHCYQLSRALGHSKKESEYFENIVAFAQARTEEERSHFLRRALDIADNAAAGTRMTGKDQYEYYATWYHSAIRSLINVCPVRDDYEQLCRMLTAPVTVGQVKKSLQLLERLGLIRRGEDGCWRLTEKSIRTGGEITQTARSEFHAQCAELAKRSILRDSPDHRHAVSLTMGISRKTYDAIVNETESFVNTVINLVKRDEGMPEQVYQYELLLFPLSTAVRKE